MEFQRSQMKVPKWWKTLICTLRGKHQYETGSASGAQECVICGKVTYPRPPSIPEPTEPSSNVPVPVGVDVVPWETIEWIGQANLRHALPTKKLRSVTIKGSNLYIDWDGNDDWNPVHHNDWAPGVDCYGRFLCFVRRNGTLIGGHVDHMKRGCKLRDTANIYGTYIFNPPVSPSETMYFAMGSNDNKNRTNIVEGKKG